MKLKKLMLKNIRSYEELEILFPHGSTLLAGNVGAGKTSILLGLQFALFGLQPGQKGSSILKNGKENAEVYLEAEIAKKEVVIKRTIKKSRDGSISQEESEIVIDGTKEKLSTSEMRSKIIYLLGYPKEFTKKSDLLYRFTVYTPQEGMKEIIQEKPEVRLDLLRHIFGIERYKRIKENCIFLNQKLKEIIKTKELLYSDISTIRERFAMEKERKIKKTKENNDLAIEISTLNLQKTKIKELLERTKKEIEEKQKIEGELSKKEVELSGKETLRNRVEKEISLLKNQLSTEITFSHEELNSTTVLLDKHKRLKEETGEKLMKLNSQISILISERENAFSQKEKVNSMTNCPTCFQNVCEEHKIKISKKANYDIEELNIKLDPMNAERNQLLKDIEREKQIIAGYEADKLRLEREKIKAENLKFLDTKLKSELFLLERILAEIEAIRTESFAIKKRIEGFQESSRIYETERNKFEDLENLSRKAEIAFAENKREIDLLMERINSDEKEIIAKEKIKLGVGRLRELLDWIETKFLVLISVTERNVLARIRYDFSKLFSEWFSMLITDQLTVKLDEDFTPIIFNRDYQMDYEFLSGGERTAVALAYRLALNQIINSVFSEIKTKNLIILDEPTDGFSEQQLDKVQDVFGQLKLDQIILVSHEQKIENFVDNVIRLKKEETSKIEASTGY
jgi:exonuclease SbcC